MISMNKTPLFSVLSLALASFALFCLAPTAMPAQAAQNSPACHANAPTTYPKTAISNGQIDAVVYLPDANTGYYRATRFDWSGIVGCLTYKGHNYFGVWFPKYAPQLNDSITGPVEDFRSADGESAQGYNQAKPGQPFVKIGVGVLRRIGDKPFNFSTTYPIIDPGRWTVHAGPSGVSFQQELKSPIGIAYIYKKTLKLLPGKPVLLLEHELKNTGKETIDTQVYNHDFFIIDNTTTGPDMVVQFPFAPNGEKPLTNGARIDGRQLVYDRELETGEFVYTFLSGFSNSPSDFDFTVENRKTGVGVEEIGDLPLSRIVFWSIPTTICPEAYVHLTIPPGQTAHWTIRYRFYAK